MSAGYSYRTVVLKYEDLFSAIESQTLDFLLGDSGVVGCMMAEYDLTPISNMVLKINNTVSPKTAGTVFTRADRTDISQVL